MNKIAVLLPSRNRPEGLKRAYESWKTNSVQSDIFFCFQDNDECLSKNIDIIEDKPYIVEGDIGLAAKINRLCDMNPGYDGYMVLNDDQIIHTPQWDSILLTELEKLEASSGHRLWILHWNDGIQGARLPQGFMSKEMLELAGSYLPRNYMRHLYTDNTFKFIGESCGILKYIPEIYIEHLHYTTGKSPIDASYIQSNSSDAYKRDEAAYIRWVEEQGLEIVRKINDVKELHLESYECLKFGAPKNLSAEQEVLVNTAFKSAQSGELDLVDLFNAAEILEAANLRTRSIQLYRQWLEHDQSPNRYAVYFNLGVALQNMNQYVYAEQAYRQAISLNPGFTQARLNLFKMLEQQGRVQEALDQRKEIERQEIASASANEPPKFVEYQFAFQGKNLKMAGRPKVESDSAIINMIFKQEMFALGHWEQAKSLNQYFIENTNKGLKPLLIDAGANIGTASLYFNNIYSGLKTVAIEPDQENAQLAQHNLAGLDAQVIQGALGKETGVMYINDIDFSPISYRVGETGNKAVDSHTIPSILSAFDSQYFPFILKIDIEGGENILFSKEAPWLDLFPLVIIELHDWMIPFENVSRNFFRNITLYDFDILNRGENTFCFNKRLLIKQA